jgi:ribosome-associated protein
MLLSPKELALALAEIADNKKARDIRVLEITDLTVLADYFVLCSGTSTTHVKTLAGEMDFVLKERGVAPHHIEGRDAGNWMLLDYGSVVVHVFLPETRAFYDLERLWADAKTLDLEGLGVE